MELQLENVVGRSVGVQRRHSGFANPDEAMLPAEDDDWTVDQFHQELFSLSWGRQTRWIRVTLNFIWALVSPKKPIDIEDKDTW